MALRPESSVSIEFNEYGEIVCRGERPSPVIHRTPEELGIPRVLPPDRPARKDIRPDWGVSRSSMHLAGVKRDGPKVAQAAPPAPRDEPPPIEEPVREIRGVEVAMPATAVMGAELIDLIANEDQAQTEEEEMPVGKYGKSTPDEVRQKIIADRGSTVRDLAEKFDVSAQTVSNIRKQAGVKTARNHGHKPPPKKTASIQRVEIDPQREGAAASMMSALAKIDTAAAVVKLELALSPAELAIVMERLSPAQQSAFVSAGLKAALLA